MRQCIDRQQILMRDMIGSRGRVGRFAIYSACQCLQTSPCGRNIIKTIINVSQEAFRLTQ